MSFAREKRQVSTARVSGWSDLDKEQRLFVAVIRPPAYAGGTDLSLLAGKIILRFAGKIFRTKQKPPE
jgi:hypothetical protein